MSNKPFEFRPSGSIEFDVVEPAAAEPANAAVAGSAAPADDAALDNDPLSIVFGRAKDSKVSAADRMLAGATIDWLINFPEDKRPKALCERYPHVANRLAADWSNRVRSTQSVQQLAADPRWGSVGFPALVQGELQRLLQQLTGTA